jgi:putative transposase
LHAGIGTDGAEREKLEHLCRYVSGLAVATGRLAATAQGQVRYTLKTPYRDGTTHVVFEPLDFIARLAALVPPPQVHLTPYHGVFAPHSRRWSGCCSPRSKNSHPPFRAARPGSAWGLLTNPFR